ncbi:MAG: hypothetical protein ABR520_11365 [Mycobacteriales bacterium]|nr:hypothetical protein [Actinomycetota bacterium]
MIASPVRELPAGFRLLHGSHSSFEQGACLMEAVAWSAGEPHSDSPACASPVLSAIGRRLNDRFDDEERQLLLPLRIALIGTRTTYQHDVRRAYVYLDAVIREIVPMGLDAVTWRDLGDLLRDLAPIVDESSAKAARAVSIEVRDEARRRRAAYVVAAYAAAAADADAYAAAVAAAADAAAVAAAADAYDAAYAAAVAYVAAVAAAAVAADAAVAAAVVAADADAAAAAAAASVAADAYADAAVAAGAVDAYAKKTPEDRARIRLLARCPIIEATVRAFERAIATEAP